MPAKRSESQVMRDRARIAELAMLGRKKVEIAAELGISPQTVARDLEAIQVEWRQQMLCSLSDHKARELARLDLIELEAWQAWDASKAGSHRIMQRVAPGTVTADNPNPPPIPLRVSVTTRNSHGDPRYMKLISDCWDQRCKLLNLYGPVDSRA